MSEHAISIVVLGFGLTALATAVVQMLQGTYSPSFFSRGVWFLLAIVSFLGVLLGDGSDTSVALAVALLIGNAAVFITSYWKGSREFGLVEKACLGLLGVAVGGWIVFDSPYLGLVLSLTAHFIGGVPTLWRVLRRPQSEQAYHWYFFFVGCIISIAASSDKSLEVILFPVYFAFFDGLIILLANRRHFIKR